MNVILPERVYLQENELRSYLLISTNPADRGLEGSRVKQLILEEREIDPLGLIMGAQRGTLKNLFSYGENVPEFDEIGDSERARKLIRDIVDEFK